VDDPLAGRTAVADLVRSTAVADPNGTRLSVAELVNSGPAAGPVSWLIQVIVLALIGQSIRAGWEESDGLSHPTCLGP